MKKPPLSPIRDAFMKLAIDGRFRSVETIRRELGLSETANVTDSLTTLQGSLAASQDEWKLRCSVLQTSSHCKVWWLEKRKEKTNG